MKKIRRRVDQTLRPRCGHRFFPRHIQQSILAGQTWNLATFTNRFSSFKKCTLFCMNHTKLQNSYNLLQTFFVVVTKFVPRLLRNQKSYGYETLHTYQVHMYLYRCWSTMIWLGHLVAKQDVTEAADIEFMNKNSHTLTYIWRFLLI